MGAAIFPVSLPISVFILVQRALGDALPLTQRHLKVRLAAPSL